MDERRHAAKAAKKAKKEAKKLMPGPTACGSGASGSDLEKEEKKASSGRSGSKRKAAAAGAEDGPAKVRRGPRQTIRIGAAGLRTIAALPDQVKDDARASAVLKSLFTSSQKDSKKNYDNVKGGSSIGAFTARTTFARF
jgi:hypothetical protein